MVRDMASFGEQVGAPATELRMDARTGRQHGRSPIETVVQGLMRR